MGGDEMKVFDIRICVFFFVFIVIECWWLWDGDLVFGGDKFGRR